MNPRIKVLYVEDDELDRDAFLQMVQEKKLPYCLTLAETLAQARACLAESCFDIILADYRLPDGHSTELFSEAMATPFVLITGTLDEQLAVQTLERGADDYLPKDRQQRHLEALPFTVGKVLFRKEIQERERRLTRELRLQSAALRSAANAILITDARGTIQWVNPAFEQLTGYSAAEAIGQNPRLLKSSRHDQAFFKSMWDTVLAGLVWRGELVNKRKDGTEYTEQMTITPVLDTDGALTHFVAIKQDVTEIVRAREVLTRSKEELERLVEERTLKLREAMAELEHMSYSMVHDMRAPLRAMQSFAEMMQVECVDCRRSPGMDYLRRIRESSNRLDHLITDALNYNRIVREHPALAPVEIGALLRGMIRSYPNLQPPAAEITIEFTELVVLGNESLLTQCFGNLLGNAVKFVVPGVPPRIRVWAEPSTHNSQPSSIIYIQDNGIGIAKEAQGRIFRMFQRTHREAEYPGTGIGLTIVKKAVERMGGRVGLESELGHGSKFWIELPGWQQAKPESR